MILFNELTQKGTPPTPPKTFVKVSSQSDTIKIILERKKIVSTLLVNLPPLTFIFSRG